MLDSAPPLARDLVLVGGGHTHLHVLKSLGMRPLQGLRVTVISRELMSPYSGMLPGLVAGHYSFDEAHIDLLPLARFAGARFYHDEVTGLDTERQLLTCRTRPQVRYDLLSIDIGSSPGMPVNDLTGESIIPVKPIDSFVTRWNHTVDRLLSKDGHASIAVVGAGAAGVELILAVRHRVLLEFKKARRDSSGIKFTLFSDSDTILPAYGKTVQARFKRVLNEKGVELRTNARVDKVTNGQLHFNGETSQAFDEVFWATSASAQAWLKDTSLELDEGGFIKVKDTLQSVSHENIFAAGDVATMVNHPRPKSGVYAVRQGPPLTENIYRSLLTLPLQAFTPQKEHLSLVSTGEKYAVASRSWWSFEGKAVWNWKNWIDQKFMDSYRQLPAMDRQGNRLRSKQVESLPGLEKLGNDDMRCGGCGGKVNADILQDVLSSLPRQTSDDVQLGLGDADDAAVVSVPAAYMQVQSIDFFRNFVDDPWIFGQLAANHALNDIFAMGARASTAMAMVTLPNAAESMVRDDLSQMLQGATTLLNDAGAVLVGGHTGEGTEASLGFSVNGLVKQGELLTRQGMKAGDYLLLTKALGTGVLFAADMRHSARGSFIQGAIDSMLQSNQRAMHCFIEHQASACTDISGFGLLGHLLEMTRGQDISIDIEIDALPSLQGALECFESGFSSSLHGANQLKEQYIGNSAVVKDHRAYPLLFDPQTSGGLLASVPGGRAEACLDQLRTMGYQDARIIGQVQDGKDPAIPFHMVTKL